MGAGLGGVRTHIHGGVCLPLVDLAHGLLLHTRLLLCVHVLQLLGIHHGLGRLDAGLARYLLQHVRLLGGHRPHALLHAPAGHNTMGPWPAPLQGGRRACRSPLLLLVHGDQRLPLSRLAQKLLLHLLLEVVKHRHLQRPHDRLGGQSQ